MKVFWALRGFFLENCRRYIIALVMLTVVAVLLMIPPYLVGRVVDRIAQETLTFDYLATTMSQLICLGLAIYVLRVLWRIYLFGASHQLAAEIRQKLYAHWTLMSPEYFQSHTVGDLMAHATNDVEAMQMTAGEGILAAFDGILTGLIVLSVMVVMLRWDLTLVALIPWPIMAVFMYHYGKSLHDGFAEAQASFGELTDISQEAVSGIRTIKAYGQESAMTAQFASVAKKSTEAYRKVERTDAKYIPTIIFTTGCSFLLAVAYGGQLIHQDALTLGKLTSFTMYLGYLIWPMFAFGWMLNIAQRGSAAHDRISNLLDQKPHIKDNGKFEKFEKLPDTNLKVAIPSFHYPKNQPAVLKNIDFILPSNKTLGLTGPTGSGKSTLIKLILRQYEVENGAVHWGEIPIEDFRLQFFRSQVAYVPQESFLFSTTVRENLALGKPNATQQDIERAAEIAALNEDIKQFPKGYDTLVGERGVTLSGGQKQRLALARAILIEAPILILDDALSAVDMSTESNILKHLKKVRRDSTTVIVSHRLSSLRHADKIVVLDDGQITEEGSHNKLLEEGGCYRQIYDLQQIEHSLDDAAPEERGGDQRNKL